MLRQLVFLMILLGFGNTACAQMNGTWVKFKSETEYHVSYPQENWQLDTLIFTPTNFERRFLKQQRRYQFIPASIKGTYKVTKKKIIFISTQNPHEVEEAFNYEFNQFGELMIGEWIYPVKENGERNYQRERFRVWTFYKKLG